MNLESKFLSTCDVLEIHKIIIQKSPLSSESDAVLDIGLLESALSQPMQTFFGEFLNPTIYDQAASYLYGLAKNHAFENGNKRTALAVTISFLRINGYCISLSKANVEDLILKAVLGELGKDDIAKIFRSGGVVPI
jgi:death on curing protein